MSVHSLSWRDVLPHAGPAPKVGKCRRTPAEQARYIGTLCASIAALLRQRPRTMREILKATGAYETDIRQALALLPNARPTIVGHRFPTWKLTA